MNNIESESERLFREHAEALALVIAKGRWRCNGTQYRDEYLDGAERLGIPEHKATVTIGIKLAIEFLQLHSVGLLFLEDMEVATKKARKRSWIDAHAFLERLASARQRSKLDAMQAEQQRLERELAIARHETLGVEGVQLLSKMNGFTATAERIADDEIKQAQRDG